MKSRNDSRAIAHAIGPEESWRDEEDEEKVWMGWCKAVLVVSMPAEDEAWIDVQVACALFCWRYFSGYYNAKFLSIL
jgi:hypothetical protein